MSLSTANFHPLSYGILLSAGISISAVSVARSSFHRPSYSKTSLKALATASSRLDRIASIALLTGVASLVARSSSMKDPSINFFPARPDQSAFNVSSPVVPDQVVKFLAVGRPGSSRRQPPTMHAYSRRYASRDASSSDSRNNLRNLRPSSQSTSNEIDGLPPGDDPGGASIPQPTSSEPTPSPSASINALKTRADGSGPPPPPPPSTDPEVNDDDDKPPTSTRVTLFALGAIFVVAFLYHVFSKLYQLFSSHGITSKVTPPRIQMPNTCKNIGTPYLSPGICDATCPYSGSEYEYCTEVYFSHSIMEAVNAYIAGNCKSCAPAPAKWKLAIFLSSFYDFIFWVLSDIFVLVLLLTVSINYYLLERLINMSRGRRRKTAALGGQAGTDLVEPITATDASLEIGRANVDETLVPKFDDIRPTVVLGQGATDLGEPAFLHDNPLVYESAISDFHVLGDETENPTCPFRMSLSAFNSEAPVFPPSPGPSVQDLIPITRREDISTSLQSPRSFGRDIFANAMAESTFVKKETPSSIDMASSMANPVHEMPAFSPSSGLDVQDTISDSGPHDSSTSAHAPQKSKLNIFGSDALAESTFVKKKTPVLSSAPSPPLNPVPIIEELILALPECGSRELSVSIHASRGFGLDILADKTNEPTIVKERETAESRDLCASIHAPLDFDQDVSNVQQLAPIVVLEPREGYRRRRRHRRSNGKKKADEVSGTGNSSLGAVDGFTSL